MKMNPWKCEELSAALYITMAERLQSVADSIAGPDQVIKEMHEAALRADDTMLRQICLDLYEDAGHDFKVFLEVLIDALLWKDWKHRSLKRFTINFSRDLSFDVRYALRKKRAASERRRADDKA